MAKACRSLAVELGELKRRMNVKVAQTPLHWSASREGTIVCEDRFNLIEPAFKTP